ALGISMELRGPLTPALSPTGRGSAPAVPRQLLLRYPRLLDHVAPSVDVADEALAHLVGRAAARLHAEADRLVLHLRRGERAVDLGVEQRDHVGRRAGAHREPVPAGDDVLREAALDRGRDILEQRIA